MNFETITKDTTCNCLEGVAEDTISTFARVLYKEKASEKDFYSKWDKGARDTDCEKVCGLKGVSVSKVCDEEVKNKIVSYYSDIFKISPNYKRGVLIFKIKKGAGVIKPTPSRNNPYHNDLYKSDAFALSAVEEVETCYLKPVSV